MYTQNGCPFVCKLYLHKVTLNTQMREGERERQGVGKREKDKEKNRRRGWEGVGEEKDDDE